MHRWSGAGDRWKVYQSLKFVAYCLKSLLPLVKILLLLYSTGLHSVQVSCDSGKQVLRELQCLAQLYPDQADWGRMAQAQKEAKELWEQGEAAQESHRKNWEKHLRGSSTGGDHG